MKPDKFDILKEVLDINHIDFMSQPLDLKDLYRFLVLSKLVYDNYDESLTIEQNIEKYLK